MTKIYTHLCYGDIYNNPLLYIKGKKRPLTQLNTHDLVSFITQKLSHLEPDQAINYCSFLNMVCQTYTLDTVQKKSDQDLRFLFNIKKQFDNKILWHHDMLLYIIAEVLRGPHIGNQLCTGEENKVVSKKLYSLFLLTNTMLNKKIDESYLYLQLLRDNPKTYNMNLTRNYYLRWIIRYKHIYKDVLDKLDKLKKPKNLIENGITLLKKDMKVTLDDYFEVIFKFFIWFIETPYLRKENKKINDKGFDLENINTFYIKKGNFSEKIMNIIESMALDLSGMKEFIENQTQYEGCDPFFKQAMTLFHRPIFKTNENIFCVIDLKFLIEGVYSGLIWRLDHILEKNKTANSSTKQLRGQYGNLIELYFVELLDKIFGKSNEGLKEKANQMLSSKMLGIH
jgi:hypothetical protein